MEENAISQSTGIIQWKNYTWVRYVNGARTTSNSNKEKYESGPGQAEELCRQQKKS
jgi:hypothetical protein